MEEPSMLILLIALSIGAEHKHYNFKNCIWENLKS